MAASERTLLRRWFEDVWNERRQDLMEHITSRDVVCHGTAGPDDVIHGLDGFRSFYEKFLGAFPDLRFSVETAICEGDVEAIRWSVRMTHAGDHLGVPATQKPVTATGMGFARIENGRIVESWDNWDMLGLAKQIGLPAADRILPRDE